MVKHMSGVGGRDGGGMSGVGGRGEVEVGEGRWDEVGGDGGGVGGRGWRWGE